MSRFTILLSLFVTIFLTSGCFSSQKKLAIFNNIAPTRNIVDSEDVPKKTGGLYQDTSYYQDYSSSHKQTSLFPSTHQTVSLPSRIDVQHHQDGLVRVGMLLPLSGEMRELGIALQNAALMAMFEIAEDKFVIQFYDTKGTADGAYDAVTDAIAHGVELILGPVFSQSVMAIAPQAKANGISVVAFSTDPSATGHGVFTIGFLLQQQVERVVSYAYMNGKTRFAVLAPDTPAGKTVVSAMEQVIDTLGAELIRVAYYNPSARDFSNVVKKLANYKERKAALENEKKKLEGLTDEISIEALKRLEQMDTLGDVGFDAVLIPEEGVRLRSLASLLSYYDVSPEQIKFLGTTLWNDAKLGKETALYNGWFSAPATKMHTQFIKRYNAGYNKQPPRIASLAYDAVALAAVLAKSKNTADFLTSSLTDPSGFAGIDGIFRLLPEGTSERGLAVMEIKKDTLKVISPAPTVFEHLSTKRNAYR